MSDSAEQPKQQGKEPGAAEDATVVGTVKDYLGLGSESKTSGGGDTATAKNRDEEAAAAEPAAKPRREVSDKEAATRENKSAIPTAGGERLGEKNWGQSQYVPDNPPPQQDADGPKVSSKEGQPTGIYKRDPAL